MATGGSEQAQTAVKDGVAWRIGTFAEVNWIETVTGLSITSGIPPVFEDYATLVLLDINCEPRAQLVSEHDQAVLRLLERHTAPQPWWLGYLETGGTDVVFPDAPRTRFYADWDYVLVEAGPEQAATWRPSCDDWRQQNSKTTELPDVIFPRDHGWLLSTLWDDDWTCIGGTQALITDLLADELLGHRTRRVTVDQEDATPPGHVAH